MAVRRGQKDDGFAAVKAEAEGEGITIQFDPDEKVYFATVPSSPDLEFADKDPKGLLDEIRACVAMDAAPELYSYDTDEDDKPVIAVNGIEEPFTADTFAEAYAQAAAEVAKTRSKPAAAKIAAKRRSAPAADVPPAAAEAEVLPPERPTNGSAADTRRIADSDVVRVLAAGLRDLGDAFGKLAEALTSQNDALLPFVGEQFSEDDPPPAKGRVRRERRA